MSAELPPIGTIIHGYANGFFGRDSYHCRRVEAVGADWIVTRKTGDFTYSGEPLVELISIENFHLIDHDYYAQQCADERGY